MTAPLSPVAQVIGVICRPCAGGPGLLVTGDRGPVPAYEALELQAQLRSNTAHEALIAAERELDAARARVANGNHARREQWLWKLSGAWASLARSWEAFRGALEIEPYISERARAARDAVLCQRAEAARAHAQELETSARFERGANSAPPDDEALACARSQLAKHAQPCGCPDCAEARGVIAGAESVQASEASHG